MIEFLIQTLGWLGTTLFILAYYMVSTTKLAATGQTYQIINLVGAICLGINVFYQRAWPAFALEIIWGSIALFALVKNRNK